MNEHKTHIAHSDEGGKFLGVVIEAQYTNTEPLFNTRCFFTVQPKAQLNNLEAISASAFIFPARFAALNSGCLIDQLRMVSTF
ncbi:hypothetical protein L4D76_26485 [Photobacterium sagamiensis]|uniref:hypothetical protein n=1 Tax=Photobacterium sagamiensis TaxID=2910241 RepID=UPI003D0B2B39